MKVSTDACIFGAYIQARPTDSNALDIGTGTGLLSLMVAQRFAHLHIDALEIDADAFAQATTNCTQSKFSNQIQVIQGDLKKFVAAKKYELIFSNPPFFENDIITTNAATNLAKHSTELSLEQLFDYASKLLHGNGVFTIIIPLHRCQDAIAFAGKNNLHLHQQLNIQHNAKKPVTKVVLTFGFVKTELIVDALIIKDGTNNYTSAMQQLMQEYYL
jgi:tRNA1Val (adenine37-N6)-methyltransferase